MSGGWLHLVLLSMNVYLVHVSYGRGECQGYTLVAANSDIKARRLACSAAPPGVFSVKNDSKARLLKELRCEGEPRVIAKI